MSGEIDCVDGRLFFIERNNGLLLIRSFPDVDIYREAFSLLYNDPDKSLFADGLISGHILNLGNEITNLNLSYSDALNAINAFEENPYLSMANAKRYYEDCVIRLRGLEEKIGYRIKEISSCPIINSYHGDLKSYLQLSLSKVIKISKSYIQKRNSFAHQGSYSICGDELAVVLGLAVQGNDLAGISANDASLHVLSTVYSIRKDLQDIGYDIMSVIECFDLFMNYFSTYLDPSWKANYLNRC